MLTYINNPVMHNDPVINALLYQSHAVNAHKNLHNIAVYEM